MMDIDTRQRLRIFSDLAELANVRNFIGRVSQANDVDADTLSDIRLAVDELVTNTITHGYSDTKGYIEIEIQIDHEQQRLIVILSDQAPVFNPFKTLATKNVAGSLLQAQAGGFGLPLVKKAMNTYKHSQIKSGGNKLTLTKQL